ncbi:hypothetical protein FRC00_006725 [Tulasnella sp. 408]|nr:hypothetical protein FRC00_006725 [Tulasnella sp. 408]
MQDGDTFFAIFSEFNITSFTKRFRLKEKAICPQNASGGGSGDPGDLGPMKVETLLVDSDPGGDLESLVFCISPVAVSIDGGYGDVFEGTHKTLGRVALKRPRVSGTGYNEDVVRVRPLLGLLERSRA